MIDKFNQWIEKIGADKLLHFFVSAWLVAECKAYGEDVVIYGLIAVSLLYYVKERLDIKADAKDMLYSFLGGFLSVVLMGLKNLL